MALFNRKSSTKLWQHRSSDSVIPTEIDLRKEFDEILFGSTTKPPRGHWVVYRRFDLTQKSPDFDEVFQTASPGPNYLYTDELVKTRHDPMLSSRLALVEIPPSLLKSGQSTFYFRYDFIPKPNDYIYDINWDNHANKPPNSIINNSYLQKYNIREVFPYREYNGRIEYWIVTVQIDQVNY